MTERVARIVKELYPNHRYVDAFRKVKARDTYICYPDPAGSQRRTSARLTDHDILRQEGFMVKVKRQAPRVKDRLNSVNNSFKQTIIDPKCKELIKDFERVVIKEGTRDLDKSDIDLTHMSDAFGYGIEWEFPVIKPSIGVQDR